jgi:hypothetical protein
LNNLDSIKFIENQIENIINNSSINNILNDNLFVFVNNKNSENKLANYDNTHSQLNLQYINSNIEEKFSLKIKMVNFALYSFEQDFNLAKFINNCLIKKSGVMCNNKYIRKVPGYVSNKTLPTINQILLEKENKNINSNTDSLLSHNTKTDNNYEFDSREIQKQQNLRKFKHNNENRDLSASPKKSKKNSCLLF